MCRKSSIIGLIVSSLLDCLICLGLVVGELISVSEYSWSKGLIAILEVFQLIDEDCSFV